MKVKAFLSFSVLTFVLNAPLAAAGTEAMMMGNKEYRSGYQSGSESALSSGELEGLSAGNSIAKKTCHMEDAATRTLRTQSCRKEMKLRLDSSDHNSVSSHSHLTKKFVAGYKKAYGKMYSELFIQKCMEVSAIHGLACASSPAADHGLGLEAQNPLGAEPAPGADEGSGATPAPAAQAVPHPAGAAI